MNVSALSCEIPSEVRRLCLQWYEGRTSNMYRLATTGFFSPEKLLAEVEKCLINSTDRGHDEELYVIKEFAEDKIGRNQAELALYRAAERVVYSSNYSYADAVEYFRLCFLEHSGHGY